MNSYDRLREARLQLKLTQDYAARALGINRTALVQIENGNRKVSDKELRGLCKIYGLSSDYVLGISSVSSPTSIFARGFEGLSEGDQNEILNLIEFKKQMGKKRILGNKE